MRELDRDAAKPPIDPTLSAPPVRAIAVVGRGRLGTAIAGALRLAGYEVHGPAGRGVPPAADAVLLCVPDAAIPAAARVAAGAASLIGHTSGATPLSALAPVPARSRFALHPLQTFTGVEDAELAARRLAGAGCAVAGGSRAAVEAALAVARRLDMAPFAVSDADRPAYHAAASIASNFLVTLEHAAETVAGGAGLSPDAARAALAPLVRATVDNWAASGAERALTGPLARGDEGTVIAQRDAIASAAPELLSLFDALAERTRALAALNRVADPARAGAPPTLAGSA